MAASSCFQAPRGSPRWASACLQRSNRARESAASAPRSSNGSPRASTESSGVWVAGTSVSPRGSRSPNHAPNVCCSRARSLRRRASSVMRARHHLRASRRSSSALAAHAVVEARLRSSSSSYSRNSCHSCGVGMRTHISTPSQPPLAASTEPSLSPSTSLPPRARAPHDSTTTCHCGGSCASRAVTVSASHPLLRDICCNCSVTSVTLAAGSSACSRNSCLWMHVHTLLTMLERYSCKMD